MTEESRTDTTQQRAKDFFLARQPILNRAQNLFAYELLFRSAASGGARITDDLSATASVIAHASELGLHNVVGTALGFLNLDAAVLMSDFVNVLPHDKVILEILETVKVTPEIIARVRILEHAGYRFALDDVVADSEELRNLLPFVSIIKIDIFGMAPQALEDLVEKFKGSGKKLLAEKVETHEEFKRCLDLGFDYFQGYYFSKPVVIQGKKLSASQLAITQIMGLIEGDADSSVIEQAIKRDAALGMTLLRLVNTPAVGASKRIDSLGQALMVLGRRQLHRWLQIMLYSEPSKNTHTVSPLLLLATTRGKLLEMMTQRLYPSKRGLGDVAFTVGIMSLMDTLFSLPMEDIVKQIPVVEDVSEALIHHAGMFGQMLSLAEQIERGDMSSIVQNNLPSLGLKLEDLTELQLLAYEWSDSIARGA